jgi:nucleotide-binding universal stress UspA family protein
MYDDILLPTDGGEETTAAVREAIDLARTYDATVHVIHVVDLDELGGYFSAGGLPEGFVDRAMEEGEQRVEATAERVREADVSARTTVSKGEPERGIVGYVAENGIDLVVMATHGRDGIRRALLGSVTEDVVRAAGCPVLTVGTTDVPDDEEGDAGDDGSGNPT